MFKINRKIEYALISLKHMSHKPQGTLTTAKEICGLYQTPFDPTSRVLQIMASKSILHAEQGAHGGYLIVRGLDKITLKELSDMIIGPIEIASCIHGEKYSDCGISSTCHIISPMLNLNENITELFSKILIADLIESKHTKEKQIREKEVKETADK